MAKTLELYIGAMCRNREHLCQKALIKNFLEVLTVLSEVAQFGRASISPPVGKVAGSNPAL